MKKIFVAMCVLAAISFSFHGWAAEDEDMGKVAPDDYFEGKKKIQTKQREEKRVRRNSITVEYYPLPVSSEIGWKFKETCEKYTWEGEKVTPVPIESAVVYRIAYQPRYGKTGIGSGNNAAILFSHLLRALAYLDRGEGGFAIISLDGDKKVYQFDLNYIPKPKDFFSGRLETYGSVGVGATIFNVEKYQRYIKSNGSNYCLSSYEGIDFGFVGQGFLGLRLNLLEFLALNGKVGYTYYNDLSNSQVKERSDDEWENTPSEWREYSSIDLGGLTMKAGLTISF